MTFNRPALTPTNPGCTAPRHLSLNAFYLGCRCPEAVTAREARRAWARERDIARWAAYAATKGRAPKPAQKPVEPVDLDEADHVVIERVLTKQLRFTAVTHPADRIAIVDTILRTAGPSMVARKLNISGETAVKLIRVAEASRAKVAA